MLLNFHVKTRACDLRFNLRPGPVLNILRVKRILVTHIVDLDRVLLPFSLFRLQATVESLVMFKLVSYITLSFWLQFIWGLWILNKHSRCTCLFFSIQSGLCIFFDYLLIYINDLVIISFVRLCFIYMYDMFESLLAI